FHSNTGPVGLQVSRRLGDRAPIHSSTAFIGFDAFPRRGHVLSRECLREQVGSPCVLRCAACRLGFIASPLTSGFTRRQLAPPRWRGLLMPCLTKRHVA